MRGEKWPSGLGGGTQESPRFPEVAVTLACSRKRKARVTGAQLSEGDGGEDRLWKVGWAAMWRTAGYGEELGLHSEAIGKGLRVLNEGVTIHITFKVTSLSVSGAVNRREQSERRERQSR